MKTSLIAGVLATLAFVSTGLAQDRPTCGPCFECGAHGDDGIHVGRPRVLERGSRQQHPTCSSTCPMGAGFGPAGARPFDTSNTVRRGARLGRFRDEIPAQWRLVRQRFQSFRCTVARWVGPTLKRKLRRIMKS